MGTRVHEMNVGQTLLSAYLSIRPRGKGIEMLLAPFLALTRMARTDRQECLSYSPFVKASMVSACTARRCSRRRVAASLMAASCCLNVGGLCMDSSLMAKDPFGGDNGGTLPQPPARGKPNAPGNPPRPAGTPPGRGNPPLAPPKRGSYGFAPLLGAPVWPTSLDVLLSSPPGLPV